MRSMMSCILKPQICEKSETLSTMVKGDPQDTNNNISSYIIKVLDIITSTSCPEIPITFSVDMCHFVAKTLAEVSSMNTKIEKTWQSFTHLQLRKKSLLKIVYPSKLKLQPESLLFPIAEFLPTKTGFRFQGCMGYSWPSVVVASQPAVLPIPPPNGWKVCVLMADWWKLQDFFVWSRWNKILKAEVWHIWEDSIYIHIHIMV